MRRNARMFAIVLRVLPVLLHTLTHTDERAQACPSRALSQAFVVVQTDHLSVARSSGIRPSSNEFKHVSLGMIERARNVGRREAPTGQLRVDLGKARCTGGGQRVQAVG
eukprot:5554138-Pleurochrysis_carterae.AAC.2